jgi:hypothetical protein
MKRLVATLIDTVAVFALGYAGFLLAETAASCGPPGTSCPLLTPVVLLFVLVLVAAYFGAGYLLWRSTPGERLSSP